jgi:hypothetical protein
LTRPAGTVPWGPHVYTPLLCFERARQPWVAAGQLSLLDAVPDTPPPLLLLALRRPGPSSFLHHSSSLDRVPELHPNFLVDACAQLFLRRAEPLPGSPSSVVQDTATSRRASGAAEPPSVLLYPCVVHHAAMAASVPVFELQPHPTAIHQHSPDAESVEHRCYILYCAGRQEAAVQSCSQAITTELESSPQKPAIAAAPWAPSSSIAGAALSCRFSPVDPFILLFLCRPGISTAPCHFHSNVLVHSSILKIHNQ